MPLYRVMRGNELLYQEETDQVKRDILSVCMSQSKILLIQINDFKDYANFANNTFTWKNEPVVFRDLVEEVCGMFDLLLQK